MLSLYRKVALIEGISYLLLLFIAMPVKHFFDFPYLVTYLGWIHGGLFIVFVGLLLLAAFKYKWSIIRVGTYFIASLLPFVPFWYEKKLAKEYGEL